jgi:hypothetical protein
MWCGVDRHRRDKIAEKKVLGRVYKIIQKEKNLKMKNKIFALISAILVLGSVTACKKDETDKKTSTENLSSLISMGNLSSDDGSLKFSASINHQDSKKDDSVLILELESDDKDFEKSFNDTVKRNVTEQWESVKEQRKKYGDKAVEHYKLTPVPSIDENFVQTFYEESFFVDLGDMPPSTSLISVNYDIKTKSWLFVDDALKLEENTPDGVTSASTAEIYVNETYPQTEEGKKVFNTEFENTFRKIDLTAFMLPCEVTGNRTLLYFYVEYAVFDETGKTKYTQGFLVYDVTNGTMKLNEKDQNGQYKWF